MMKYELLPQQLLHEGTCTSENFFIPNIPADNDILRAHSSTYYARLCTGELTAREIRKTGFPWSQEMVERERMIAGGTIMGCDYALQNGIAMNIAGGTHHAFSDRGEAFCLLNDQAIGAHYLLASGKACKILIIDLDVHQGNGTAEIFQNRPEVFTFSMHGKANYPFKKEVSDLDIPLEKHTTDSEYLSILKETLIALIEDLKPDFVFYLSGVDILASDKLGTLSCSVSGCRKRDEIVFNLCRQNDIPVQCSMGGGYSPDIRTIVEAHANTYRTAREIFF